MNDDLTIIKKNYGEKMMHLCRSLFPTILEIPGKLSELLLDNFAPSKFLYDDVSGYQIDNFKNYIYSLLDEKQEDINTNKTPTELLNESGYNLYECKTEEDIQKFKKYYKSGEELCTFNGGRLKKCYVFFAVKKNVDEIKREDFINPKREDKYGTSVISIQFTKGNVNTLSIKNRYNHTVDNPDATFSNNLENIIPGLTKSFEQVYNFNINQNEKNFKLHNYIKANDGKWYKYNYEINNIYYCPDNTIIDNFEVVKYDPDTYLVVDYFILNLHNKKIFLYDSNLNDSFVDGLQDIKKINIIKENDTKKIEVLTDNDNEVTIRIDKYNRIISYENKKINLINDNFLYKNDTLTNLDLPNLEEVGNNFLYNNTIISEIYLPNLVVVGNDFFRWNLSALKVDLPKLERCGDDFFYDNSSMIYLSLPKLKEAGNSFMLNNIKLEYLDVNNLINVGDYFLTNNVNLEILKADNLKYTGDHFLEINKQLKILSLPKVEFVGNSFFRTNSIISNIYMPNLVVVGNDFFSMNQGIKIIDLPNLQKAGNNFFNSSIVVEEVYLDKLERVGDHFLSSIYKLKSYYLPKLELIGDYFLSYEQRFRDFILQSVRFNYENEFYDKLVRTR